MSRLLYRRDRAPLLVPVMTTEPAAKPKDDPFATLCRRLERSGYLWLRAREKLVTGGCAPAGSRRLSGA